LKITTDRHKASRGLSATAGLLVFPLGQCTLCLNDDENMATNINHRYLTSYICEYGHCDDEKLSPTSYPALNGNVLTAVAEEHSSTCHRQPV